MELPVQNQVALGVQPPDHPMDTDLDLMSVFDSVTDRLAYNAVAPHAPQTRCEVEFSP